MIPIRLRWWFKIATPDKRERAKIPLRSGGLHQTVKLLIYRILPVPDDLAVDLDKDIDSITALMVTDAGTGAAVWCLRTDFVSVAAGEMGFIVIGAIHVVAFQPYRHLIFGSSVTRINNQLPAMRYSGDDVIDDVLHNRIDGGKNFG